MLPLLLAILALILLARWAKRLKRQPHRSGADAPPKSRFGFFALVEVIAVVLTLAGAGVVLARVVRPLFQ